MIAFISCILCWIIGVVMGSDHRIIARLADEVLRLRAELPKNQGETDKGSSI